MHKLILLIDDDYDEYFILREALHITGSGDCIWACGLEQAMQLLENVLPDYIFIDYNMPRKNGLECIGEIRQLITLQQVPLVMYSTNISESMATQAREKGAAYCLQKPTSFTVLTRQLSEIVV
jgi:DNA-binding response OmpR family regulator